MQFRGMVSALLEDDTVSTASEYGAFELELNALVRKHFPHWGARDLTAVSLQIVGRKGDDLALIDYAIQIAAKQSVSA